MRRAFSSRLLHLFLIVWLAATVMLLLIATTAPLRNPQMPLVIGLIHARGETAIWLTLLPALCGVAALVGIFGRRRSGPYFLLAYSLFWLVILVGGLLEAMLHASLPALDQLSPWTWVVGTTTFGTMVAAFALLGVWSIQQLTADSADHPAS